MRAPFIIHAKDEPFADNYDEEFTVILGDWYHDPVAQLNKDVFMSKYNPTGAEPVPDQALIYFAQNGSYLTDSSGNVAFNDNATLPFEAGKTYRLRVINTSSFAMFFFWLEGHDMRVIEVDGVSTFFSSSGWSGRSGPPPTLDWSAYGVDYGFFRSEC